MDNFFFVKNLPRVRDVYTSGALEVFKKFLRVKKMSRVCVACEEILGKTASRACASRAYMARASRTRRVRARAKRILGKTVCAFFIFCVRAYVTQIA